MYAAAGEGESTTDLSWDGQTMIYENGVLLAESERFPRGPRRSVADVDLDLLRAERLRMGTFDDNRRHHAGRLDGYRRVELTLNPPAGDIGLRRQVERFPFVPADETRLEQDCYEAYNIQVSGLEQRMRAIGEPKVVIGVSGGLDSTHALIVAAKAMDREGRPRSDILAFTLPGFATGEHTKHNAIRLTKSLGIPLEEIDITRAARLMLTDLGHPFSAGEPLYDVTFENVQAGLRTDYLFRAANQRGGIVLGTGDLSELALGWSTYGVGDQMSHYNVNSGVPKTLMQHLVRWVVSSGQFDDEVNETLLSILGTEITPELVPTGEDETPQSTEQKIGPYALQDFSLFHVLRYGFRPSKIAFLAHHAWRDATRGGVAGGLPGRGPAGVLAARDPALAGGLPLALLRVQPVQALGDAERPEGLGRRQPVAEGRLAGPVGRVVANVAGRAAPRGPGGVARVTLPAGRCTSGATGCRAGRPPTRARSGHGARRRRRGRASRPGRASSDAAPWARPCSGTRRTGRAPGR